MINVDKNGRGRVENAMQNAIADAAGVSPLRVTNFYVSKFFKYCLIYSEIFFFSSKP